MLNFILARLGETSTYRNLFVLLTAVGVSVAPELQNSIISIGLGTAGVLGAVLPDKLK